MADILSYPLNETDYDASDFGAYHGTRTRGVYSSDTDFIVTKTGGLEVTVGTGRGWLKVTDNWGLTVWNENPVVLTLDPGDLVLDTYVAIVIGFSKTDNKVSIYTRAGEPTSTVVYPQPIRSADVDEIIPCVVRVRSGSVDILESDIIDTRLDADMCGIMSDGVTSIPTSQLFLEFNAKVDELITVNGQKLDDFYTDWETKYANFEIIDNLTSTDTDKALSANQGSVIKSIIDTKSDGTNPYLKGDDVYINKKGDHTAISEILSFFRDGNTDGYRDAAIRCIDRDILRMSGKFRIANVAPYLNDQGTMYGTIGSASEEFQEGYFGTVYAKTSVLPEVGDTGYLGYSTRRWGQGHFNNLYSSTGGVSVSSDDNVKTYKAWDDRFDTILDKVEEQAFTYNEGTSGRTHLGYSAQELEEAVLDAGLTLKDFACVIIDKAYTDEDGNEVPEIYSIRPMELIPLISRKVKQQAKVIESMEERLAKLEELTNTEK